MPSRNTDSSSGGPPTGTAATGEVASEGPRRLLAPSALSREDVLQGLPIASESVLFRRVMGRAAGGDISPGGAALVEERGGGVGCSGGARQVSGLLEALVGEVAARSCAVAVDSNTQTEETGRSHQENLGWCFSLRVPSVEMSPARAGGDLPLIIPTTLGFLWNGQRVGKE